MTAAQPIDLNKVEKYIAESKADGLKATAIRNDYLEVLIALARQQHEPSGNAGEVAASIDSPEFRDIIDAMLNEYWESEPHVAKLIAYIESRAPFIAHIDAQLARTYQSGRTAAIEDYKPVVDDLRAQLASAPAAPHAQAEPVGYISEGTRAMLAAGCSTPITISISTGKAAVWCAPMYLSVPVPQEAEGCGCQQGQCCGICDPIKQKEAEQAEPVRIEKLRTALRRISETRFGNDGDCGVTSIADDALYADEQEAKQAAPAAVTDERASYEAWCIRKGYNTNKWHNGSYVDSYTLNGLEAWTARAALAQPAAPAVTDAARDVLADAKDADRWRWMRAHWFLFGTVAHSRTTTIGMNMHRINVAGDVHTLDVAVDAAIIDDRTQSKE